jgi:hypothetical protein
MDNLVDGNPHALHAGLPMADSRIDGNPLKWHVDALRVQVSDRVISSSTPRAGHAMPHTFRNKNKTQGLCFRGARFSGDDPRRAVTSIRNMARWQASFGYFRQDHKSNKTRELRNGFLESVQRRLQPTFPGSGR